MTERTVRSRTAGIGAVAVLGIALAPAGCSQQDSSESVISSRHPTQGAVGAAVQRVSRTVALAMDPHSTSTAAGSATRETPEMQFSGSGPTATLRVVPDEQHQAPTAVRVPGGWALSWTDQDHVRALFARVDNAGKLLSAPVVVHESRT